MPKCILLVMKTLSNGLNIERKRFGVSGKDWSETAGRQSDTAQSE